MKPWAKRFYKSKAWLKCRDGYIKSVNGLCETCLRKGKITPGYIVHHKVTLTPSNINNPEITLNWKLLEYNCLYCHNQITFGQDNMQEGLCFDENGNLIQTIPPGQAK